MPRNRNTESKLPGHVRDRRTGSVIIYTLGYIMAALRVLLVLCGVLALMQPLSADELKRPEESLKLSPAAEAFVVGNAVYAVLHEFGHAIIQDFELPILGLEENSADTIATVAIVLLDRRKPHTGLAAVLAFAALVQAHVWQTGFEREHQKTMLWAQHGLSAQRFARLTCLLYGSDTERFGWVAESAEMENIRADGCQEEWRKAEHAVTWVRDSYGVAISDRDSRADTKVEIRHGAALDDDTAAWRTILERRETLENIAIAIDQIIEFPESLTLRTRRCGSPNAYWDPDYREVILCYELLTEVSRIADRPEIGRIFERF